MENLYLIRKVEKQKVIWLNSLSLFCFPFLYNLHYKKVLREVDNLKNPEKPTQSFLQPFWVGWQIV